MLSLVRTRCGGIAAQVYTATIRQCSCRSASGTMVLDRRSLSYAALGLGPSWVLLDGIFAEVALFDRTQPEGLALATYLTAVSAVANTIVVPGHAVVQRRVQWSLRTWVGGAVYAQLATALGIGGLLARARRRRVGRALSVRLRHFTRGQLPAARVEPLGGGDRARHAHRRAHGRRQRGRSAPGLPRAAAARRQRAEGVRPDAVLPLPSGAPAPAGRKFPRHRARGQGRAGRDRVAQGLRALSRNVAADSARPRRRTTKAARSAGCPRKKKKTRPGPETRLLSLKMPPSVKTGARRGAGSAHARMSTPRLLGRVLSARLLGVTAVVPALRGVADRAGGVQGRRGVSGGRRQRLVSSRASWARSSRCGATRP